jgi:hypothetical protein
MKLFWHGYSPPVVILLAFLAGFGLSGCEGDDGDTGPAGLTGADGSDGADGGDGINCWDLNQNGLGDLPDEDTNGDGVVDTFDCNAYASGAYESEQPHKSYFTEHAYEGTESCMNCHGPIGDEIINTGHFKWEGVASNIEGFEGGNHGKKDILNNFCIAIASNEGRCTQCHIGYGYKDASFDFSDPDNVDCLVCHDQTGTYAKAPTTAGLPADEVDLTFVAQSVAENGGVPTIDNCIFCHARAGGDDNVKHGDLSMSLANTTSEFDVHMGTAESGGADFECVACHQVEKDGEGNVLSHGIGGMPYHSVDEGEMKDSLSTWKPTASLLTKSLPARSAISRPLLAIRRPRSSGIGPKRARISPIPRNKASPPEIPTTRRRAASSGRTTYDRRCAISMASIRSSWPALTTSTLACRRSSRSPSATTRTRTP